MKAGVCGGTVFLGPLARALLGIMRWEQARVARADARRRAALSGLICECISVQNVSAKGFAKLATTW